MVLQGLYIFPHGCMVQDITSPEMKSILPKHASELHTACTEMSSWIFDENPVEHIILVTPHGLALKDNLGIYGNQSYEGTAEWNGSWSNFTLKCENNRSVSTDLYSF